jgi:hypothetical protein
MERKVALVAGAAGIIGRDLVEHLSSGKEKEVIGLETGGNPCVYVAHRSYR